MPTSQAMRSSPGQALAAINVWLRWHLRPAAARKADGPPVTAPVSEWTTHTTAARGRDEEASGSAWSRPARCGKPGAGPGVRLPAAVGLRDRDRPPQADMGEGQPVLRSKEPEGIA